MITRLVLIFGICLSICAGKAYGITVVDSSYSREAASVKAAGKTGVTSAGKTLTVPGSRPASNKSHDMKANVTTSGAKPAAAANVTREDFLLEKVDGNVFYTKDGSKIEIPTDVKIIYRMKTRKAISVELTYLNGKLIQAMLR